MKKLLQIVTPWMLSFLLLLSWNSFAQHNVITDNGPDPVTEFFEDFDDLDTPDLPEGWSKIVEATTDFAGIGTSTVGTPFSEPNHLRFANSSDAEPTMIASTMEVTNFGSNWLNFWASLSSAVQEAKIIVGYMSDPDEEDTFVAIDTLLVAGNIYQQHFFEYDDLDDEDVYHIAFKYLPEVTFRTMYIDDMAWEEAPSDPVLSILPEDGDFGLVDVDGSKTQTYLLRNVGTGTLTINENDISILGDDADMFSIAGDPDYPFEIELGEGDTLEVMFSPTSEGPKSAQLEIVSNAGNSPFLLDLSGEGLGTISEFFEDFNGVETPDLPGGWSKINESSAGGVQTVTVTDPNSPPNHVRIQTGNDGDAIRMLVGPRVNNFETNWLRFYSKMSAASHINDLVVGYTTDRFDSDMFVPLDTVEVDGNEYEQYTVVLSDGLTDEDEYNIAFKFKPEINFRNLFIDDVLWEAAPTEAIVIVDPEEFDFGLQQIGTVSDEQEFTITNDGVIDVTIGPDDIEITGPNADVFILNNLDEETVIEFGESVTIGVNFAPEVLGDKQATIEVMDLEISITGEGADATITKFPHLEDFNDVETPDLPFGWKKIVDNPTLTGALVETVTSNSPYSPPNHVRIFSDDNEDADVMLISPPVVDIEDLRIRFWAKSNLSSNVPDLIIGTMSDPEDASTFNAFYTIEGEDNISNSYAYFVVSFDDTVGEDEHIVFKHGSTPSFNRSIFLDDIVFEEIPTGPVLAVDPESYDFGKHQIGTSTFPVDFIVSNEGIGTLTLTSEDFSITGEDSDRFILGEIVEDIELEEFETDTITLAFFPENTGDKQAILDIDGLEIPLSGEGIDATITDIPHFEDFDEVETPDLPLGWTSIVINPDYSDAIVRTITTQNPHSEPNHVQMLSNDYDDAHVMLISPPVEDLDETRLRFYAKCNLTSNVPDLIVGTMSDPSDVTTFNPITVIEGGDDLTNSYQQYSVPMMLAGDDAHIAFKHGSTPSFNRSIFIDDVLIEEMPDEPFMVVSPEEHDFGIIQIGTTSDVQEFTILNDAGGTLTLGPEDIEITGVDAEDFVLNNLTEEVNLSGGESVDISVAFAPETVGDKIATLEIDGEEFPLSGEGFDATISDFPWLEDFSGLSDGEIPLGWTRDHSNWGAVQSNNAGGSAPEIRFHWSPSFDGISYFTTPIIDTSDYEEMMLTFRHNINNYSSPGTYTLSVVAIVGEEEHLLHEWVDPDNVAAEEIVTLLTEDDHGIGSEEFYIAWVFDGNSYDINQWFIDDIQLEEAPDRYTVTFNVEDEDGNTINDAIITLNNQENEAGNYVFTDVFEGTYDYTVEAEHFETYSGTDLLVDEDITVDVEMTAATYTITFEVEDLDENEITNATITFGDVTNAPGDYVFEDVTAGIYDYTVEADHFETLTVENFEVSADAMVKAELTPTVYTVTFNVEDEGGAEITDAVITFDGVTNAAGDYVFDDITFGEYDYTVEADHFETYTGEDYLVDGDATIDVILEHSTYTVTFNIQDNLGNPIIDATITFDGETNEEGDYEFEEITYGTYDYMVEAPGFETYSAEGYEVTEDVVIFVELDEASYTVTFTVEDENGNEINNAVITFGDVTNPEGEYVFTDVSAGFYDYTVTAEGYQTLEEIDFEVTEDVIIPVILAELVQTFAVTFNVDMTDSEEFDPDVHEVFITGGFGDDMDWEVPGENPDLTMERVNDSMIYTITLDLEAGDYEYKYFSDAYGQGFEGGEWDGGDNRQITVAEDKVIDDIWGVHPDDVSVADATLVNLEMYPNPASSSVNIVSDENINELRVIDMLGQVVYSVSVDNNQYQLNVNQLRDGVYFVQILTDKGFVTERLQVSK